MKEVSRVELRTPGYTFLHDFALTPTHIVVIISPVALDATPFLLGRDSAAASVKWQDGKPAEVHLLGRPVIDAPAVGRPQQQQQGPGDVGRIRHQPEHLVSQVRRSIDCAGLHAGGSPLSKYEMLCTKDKMPKRSCMPSCMLCRWVCLQC